MRSLGKSRCQIFLDTRHFVVTPEKLVQFKDKGLLIELFDYALLVRSRPWTTPLLLSLMLSWLSVVLRAVYTHI